MSAPPPPSPLQCSTCHCPLDLGSPCPTCGPRSVEEEHEEPVTAESRTPSPQEAAVVADSHQIVPRSLHASAPATDATHDLAAREDGIRPFLLLSSSNPSGAASPLILHIMEMVSLFASRLFRESETRDTAAALDSGITDLSRPPDPGARVLQQMNQDAYRNLSRTSDRGATISEQQMEAFLGLEPTPDAAGVNSSELHFHEPRASQMPDEGETLHDGNTLPGDGLDSLSRLLHLLSRTGRNRGASNSNHRVPDSVLRPALHMLIQRMLEGEVERYGSPPASKAAIEAMPTLTIGKQVTNVDELHCAVCKEAFQLGGKVREMPCKHLYHSDCILPWLALHSSCPLCRYEMPVQEVTDSPPTAAEGSSPDGQRGAGSERNSRQHGFAIVGVSGPGINALSMFVFEFSIRDRTPTQNDQEEQHIEDDTVDDGSESSMPSSVIQSQVSLEAEGPESPTVQPELPTARSEQESGSGSSLASRSRSIFSWVFQHNDSARTNGRQIEDSNPDGANHTSQRPNTSSDTGDYSHSGRGRSFWW